MAITSKQKRLFFAIVAINMTALPLISVASESTWPISPGTSDGEIFLSASGGVMASNCNYLGKMQACIIQDGGAPKYLPHSSLTNSYVFGISPDGSIVTGSIRETNSSILSPVFWDKNYALHNLALFDNPDYKTQYLTTIGASNYGNIIIGNATITVDHGDTLTRAIAWSGEDKAIHNLGTLGNAADSKAVAISANGSTIIGTVLLDDGIGQRAVFWDNPTATSPTALNMLTSDSYAQAVAVSADGNIIIGNSGQGRIFLKNAVFWIKDSKDAYKLDGLGGATDNTAAISADGNTIVGYSSVFNSSLRTEFNHAVSWVRQGETYVVKDLGSPNNSYHSQALAVSAYGGVIVGYIKNSQNIDQAVVWVGGDQSPQELGVVNRADDNSSYQATGVSANGNIIVGTRNIGQVTTSMIWKSTSGEDVDPGPGNPEPGNPEPGNPGSGDPGGGYIGIDVDNTYNSLVGLAVDSFDVLESQRLGLVNLQRSYVPPITGKTYYLLTTNAGGFNSNSEVIGGILAAHAFTDHFSAGAIFSQSLYNNLPDSFRHNSKNLGGSLFAQWQAPTEKGIWYLRGALAANRYKAERVRKLLSGTEAGAGEIRINGVGGSLELGLSNDLSNRKAWGYYGGLRYNDLKMKGYTETNAYFPFTYSDVTYQQSAVYAGINYSMKLGQKMEWFINAQLEHDVDYQDPVIVAQAEYLAPFRLSADFRHTRASLSTALNFQFNDALSIELMPYATQTATHDTALGAFLKVIGTF